MRSQVSAKIRMVHRGRSVPRGLLKLGSGAALTTLAVLTPFQLHAAAPDAWFLLIVYFGPGIWLVDWGGRMLGDGATDLISRWSWRSMRSGRAMILDRTGVRYCGDFPGATELFVAWADVTGTAFRALPGSSWWFCLDTAAHRADPVLRAAGPTGTVAARRLRENLDWFGTPLAVNLEICPGARAARLDRAIKSWSGGRLGCHPVEPAWWRPPPLPVIFRGPRATGRPTPVGQLFVAGAAILCGSVILGTNASDRDGELPVISGVGLVLGGYLVLASVLLGARVTKAAPAAAEDDPDAAAAALMTRAYARMQAGDLDGAAETYETVIAGPTSRHTRDAVLGRASLAMRQGRVDEARAVFASLNASDDPARAALGRIYLSVMAVAGGQATPDDFARFREAAAAGDPFASSYLTLMETAIWPDSGPERAD